MGNCFSNGSERNLLCHFSLFQVPGFSVLIWKSISFCFPPFSETVDMFLRMVCKDSPKVHCLRLVEVSHKCRPCV